MNYPRRFLPVVQAKHIDCIYPSKALQPTFDVIEQAYIVYLELRKLRVQILVGDRGSWDLFLDIKLCFFGNFFIFACDRVLLHPTETLF